MRIRFHRAFFLAAAGALAMTGLASAQSRMSTTAMTCAQAQGVVESAGAIVLATGGGGYDRFVRSGTFCTAQEMPVPTWARTRDVAHCVVGYVCEDRSGRDPTPD